VEQRWRAVATLATSHVAYTVAPERGVRPEHLLAHGALVPHPLLHDRQAHVALVVIFEVNDTVGIQS
jgi:hypothetical protein